MTQPEHRRPTAPKEVYPPTVGYAMRQLLAVLADIAGNENAPPGDSPERGIRSDDAEPPQR